MGEIIKNRDEKKFIANIQQPQQPEIIRETSKKILLGLHASGKTTFMAALWDLLQHDYSPTDLFNLINIHLIDTEYLTEIHEFWSAYKEVLHTRYEDRHHIDLYIQNINSQRQHTLSFLDLPGDIFRECWTERHWDESIDQYVQNADGVILFINPINQMYPNSINEVYEVYHDVFLDPQDYPFDIDSFFEDMAIPWDVKPWEADDAPSQVKLIDLLQIVLQKCHPDCRFTIIVSAWDTIQFNNISPELWVGRRLPLLMQYLISNFSYRKNFKIFGLSAQGAPYSPGAERERAKQKLENLDTIKRIIVSKAKNEPGTMFDILKWICNE